MQEPYTGPEKRKTARKLEELKVEYALSDDLEEKKGLTKTKVAQSRDLGDGGLCLWVDEEINFKEGSKLYTIVNLPEQNKIFFIAGVVYIHPEGEGHRYRIGLRYIEISDEDRKTISGFVGAP